MQSNLLSHALTVEFPELATAVQNLKANDAHFAKLLDEHDAVDLRITRDEQKIEVLADSELHSLKHRRMQLKDELYALAKAAK